MSRSSTRRTAGTRLALRFSDGGAQTEATPLEGAAPADEAAPEVPPVESLHPPDAADPSPVEEEPQKAGRTYSRDELNRIIAAERAKERKAALLEFQEKEEAAQRLSQMGQDERLQYEKEQAEQRANEAEAALSAFQRKDEAVHLAGKSSLPLEFLDLFDFRTMTGEQVHASIASLSRVFHGAVETRMNARLAQRPPAMARNSRPAAPEEIQLAAALGRGKAQQDKTAKAILERYVNGG